MAGADDAPEKFFVHPQASHFLNVFFFYAYACTARRARADILSLGCGDLRDLLYSIVLHGRRGVSCGPVPRQLTFTLNDWEPAIHARNLVMLQLILDSRHLLEPVAADILDDRMEAMDVSGSLATSAPAEQKIGDAVRKTKSKANSKTCNVNTKAGSPATGAACSKGLQGGQEHNAQFAQRVGVIFSAMYNVFVDADVLRMIQDVAGRLAASAASSEDWTSTELGRLVHFADDRSQDRVSDVLARYADRGLQKRCPAASVKKERSAFITKRVPKDGTIMSRCMGLASLRQKHTLQAYNEMVQKYLAEGILDPFPLLLADQTAPVKRQPSKLVNPLLLVTERKGTMYSLHYAAFPLDAFHTEVASWKLRDESTQDEHGKLAPRVLKQHNLDTRRFMAGLPTAPARRRVQDAWFGAALEQLAQMCGGFLTATRIMPAEIDSDTQPAAEHLRISIHVGDAINFCDSILASSLSEGPFKDGVSPTRSSSSSPTFKGIAFQQGTLQPLRLRQDTFKGPRADFDVISTSNLAEHLGVVNILVASAPLLKPQPHSVLLTSFMASVGTLRLHKDTEAFYKKLFCMTSQAAAILLGVVPVSSLSSVVGHADTTSLVFSMGSKLSSGCLNFDNGIASTLRLTWKRPAQVSATDSPSGPTYILGDISPSEFVNLTLPVYKAMFAHMPTTAMLHSGVSAQGTVTERFKNLVMPKHYTSVSFGRLLALAGRRLRLKTAHFQSALRAIVGSSSLMLAPNLMQEQDALFHALGLAPIAQVSLRTPVDIRRVVLLVPASGLSLIREFNAPEVYLALRGTQGVFDNHFVSVHIAFVRVRRGGRVVTEDGNDWRSLSKHLAVRDTREDDPDAELMVSAIVPTYALMMAPPALTELQLRPRDSVDMFKAPKDVMRRLGGQLWKVFYRANLANTDRTAVLMPAGPSWPWKSSSLPPPLVFPKRALSGRCEGAEGSGKPKAAFLQRSIHGKSIVDQSFDLMGQPGRGRDAPLVCRMKLVMVNRVAREHLDTGRVPHVEPSQDPCSVRVILGEELIHIARFPFPVRSKGVRVVPNKSKGYVHFTVLPLEGLLAVPFALTTCNVEEDGWRTLLSTFCWPMCVPLASLPRLDFNAEWAHHEVMGKMSSHNSERPSQEGASRSSTGGPHLGFRGMKASISDIAASACTTHKEDNPVWKHEWVCITKNQRRNEPALWVWVNEILLDPSNQALVLDCCIMPVDSMDHEAALQLGAVVGGMSTKFLQAGQEEFELWTALLPVAVERARQTYAHASDCIYSIPSDAIPSTASPIICSCGIGKDLPPAFMESMRSVKPMTGGGAVSTLVYRAALSPLYAPPEMTAASASTTKSKAPPKAGGASCAKCGKGGSSMRCSRCRKVRYCSNECQRGDWKNHKSKCVAGSGSA